MTAKLEAIPVSASAVETTHLVLPSHTNALGTIFGGQLMSWCDLAAAIAASRHSHRVCVTASMDQLDFIHPIRLGDAVILKATVNFVGRTSMEVGVRVESEDPLTGKRIYAATAYLTFVAVDDAGDPVAVPPVRPETEDEIRRFQEAEERRRYRLSQKKK